jgi:hypothetical protein
MLNSNKVISNIFTNMVFPHLNVSETLSSTPLRPVDTSIIIIQDHICSRHKNISKVKEFKELYQFEKKLYTFISSKYFCLSRTHGSDGLSLGHPM